jgi:hypothetical protein
MGRNFISGWIISALLVAGVVSCSDPDDGGDKGQALRPGGDADDDGIANDEDDSDGDGIPDSEDDDADGDGIPNDEDDDPAGGGPNSGDGDDDDGAGAVPRTLPQFPGAGTSDAGDPLPGGMLCDAVPGQTVEVPEREEKCFFDKNNPDDPNVAATLEQVLECVEDTDTIHLRLTFHPWFVDNTYGVNSIGWPPRRGHRWTDLTKSDHAEIILTNDAGEIVLRFKLDYITEDPSAPSGYSSLGVTGGDGSVLVGDASAIVKWSTSIDRNINERGLDEYIPDSPATDEDFTANPDAPEWDFRVVYEAWVDASIFDDGGFGGATIEYVHASPAKSSSDTIETEPRDCPPPPDDCPGTDPDADCGQGGVGGGGSGGTGGDGGDPCEDNDPDTFCGEGGVGGSSDSGSGGSSGSGGDNGGDPEDPCEDNDPDTVCGDGSAGDGGDPQYCEDHPDDPACMVD